MGTKAYYELLAVEFAKHIDDINFKDKCRIAYWFALVDIDMSAINKTVTNLAIAYSEAFMIREHNGELP